MKKDEGGPARVIFLFLLKVIPILYPYVPAFMGVGAKEDVLQVKPNERNKQWN